MDKQTTAHQYNEIQLGIKEEWTTDTCNKQDDFQIYIFNLDNTSQLQTLYSATYSLF